MPIKVLNIDDSVFMRTVLQHMLSTDSDIKVIEPAPNGLIGLERIEQFQPDIITLDVEMPIMDGIETLKAIMKKWDIPIIMLSHYTAEGADITIKALQIGASDFIQKPKASLSFQMSDIQDELILKIKTLANTKTDKRKTETYQSPMIDTKVNIPSPIPEVKQVINARTPVRRMAGVFKLVTIGISTGGPKTLSEFLPRINGDVNAAFLVVQHMPEGFTLALAKRLNELSALTVKEAVDGELVQRGFCYIAPGNSHMKIVPGKNDQVIIKLSDDEKVSGHRPSADVLFKSVADSFGDRVVGVIMTGMGSDGARSLGEIQRKGGYTIAQDENSCVVFGMPKVAIELKHVDEIASLSLIHKSIMDQL